MDKEQALQVIEQALNVATQKGAFNLNDASQVINALVILKSEDED